MTRRFHSTIKGFTILEAIAAILILSMIGICMSHFLLGSSKASTQVRKMTKASSLLDMVFEQYTASSAYNFYTLTSMNVTNQSPKDFFKTSDNLTFDGMAITTQVFYSTDQSSCTVNVTLTWKEGSQEKTLTRSKFFMPQNSQPAGADVRVIVTHNGQGVPGLVATAPSVQGGSATATTDGTGSALLRMVLTGVGIPVNVASNLGEYNSAPGNPGLLGYYVVSSGSFVTSVTTTSVIDVTALNVISITDFQPAGLITGRVVNDDASADVGGLVVSLGTATPTYVYKTGAFRRCGLGSAACPVTTKSNGDYAFYNVISSSVTLFVDGAFGSYPTANPASAGFKYGTINLSPYPYMLDDWDLSSSHPTLRPDLHVRRRGWVVVTPTFNGSPLPAGTTVTIVTPPTRVLGAQDYTGSTDIAGTVRFYNIVLSNSSSFSFSIRGQKLPPPDPGYYGIRSWTCPGTCLAQANPVALPMEEGYRLLGQLQDKVGNPPGNIDGITVTLPAYNIRHPTNSSGHFVYPNFSPIFSGNPYSGSPGVPSPVLFFLSNWRVVIPGTVNGRTVDLATGQPAPYIPLLKGSTVPVLTDGSGNFSFSNFPYYRPYYSHKVYCVPADNECYPASNATPPATTTMPIDTSRTEAMISGAPDTGWDVLDTFREPLLPGQTINNVQIRVQLRYYKVRGLLMNALTGQPVQGVKIKDAVTGEDEATSQADGSWIGWFRVTGRTSTNTGRVTVESAAQTVSGQNYPAIPPVNVTVPLTATPATPLTQDLIYNNVGGEGI